ASAAATGRESRARRRRRSPRSSSRRGRSRRGASCVGEDNSMPEPIDLLHLGRRHSIGCYLIDSEDGPALFDCGPSTTIAALKEGLAANGLVLAEVRHLLLSHIHLDHAGAAG